MGVLKEMVLILVVVAVAAGATFIVHPKAPAVYQQSPPVENEITAEEARRMEGAVVWIDARSRQDFQRGHFEGALLLK